jgi:ribosomal protein S18 acetylase RimI-like enzyme
MLQYLTKITLRCSLLDTMTYFPKIQFSDRKLDVDIAQLQGLFNLAAFWAKNRSLEDLAIAIANSDPVITMWDSSDTLSVSTSANRLIGFARATSDGIYRATIWDVVIHPEYRGAGLGSKLVETVLSHPKMNKVERVYLMTTHQQKFYERIGFKANSTTTMVLHNPSPQNSGILDEIQYPEPIRG